LGLDERVYARRGMRAGSKVAAVALSLGALLGSRRVDASPTARLVYARGAGASSCPDEEVLRAAVATRLGFDPFFPWARQTVVVLVSKAPEGYVAHVEVVDDTNTAHGTRQLGGGDMTCEGLLDAVALAITIALEAPEPPPRRDSDVATEAVPTPAEPPQRSPVIPEPPPATDAPEDNPTPASPVVTRPHAFLALEALGSIGTAPEVSAGGELSGGLRWGRWSVALGIRADAPGSTQAGSEPGQVAVTLVTGSVSPCVHVGPVFGCAVGMVGELRATGVDVSGGRAAPTLFVAVGPRIGTEFPLGKGFAWRIDAEALGNLQRASVDLDGKQAWQAPPVLGSVAGGVVLHFR
jgi:hypothetical protein